MNQQCKTCFLVVPDGARCPIHPNSTMSRVADPVSEAYALIVDDPQAREYYHAMSLVAQDKTGWADEMYLGSPEGCRTLAASQRAGDIGRQTIRRLLDGGYKSPVGWLTF